MTPRARRVVVVGGGITGLAAAAEVRRREPASTVTVLEGSDRVGGRIGLGEVAGLAVDTGAEALLARRPEALDLARRAGLEADLVHPSTVAAGLYARGRLRPLPRPTAMGVPGDLRALAGVLTRAEQARAAFDLVLPGLPLADGEDVAVGRLVARRFGDAVADRLVEPLLGGVYAGRARELSLAMTVPALLAAARRERTLTAAVRAAAPAAAGGGPVFAGIRGGVGRLPEAVAALAGEVRTRTTVRALERTATGWRIVCGPAPQPQALEADAVVLAVPAAPAARLLAPHVPAAAAGLARLAYASVALVTLALPAAELRRPLRGSGVLVPPVEHRAVKAVTYSSTKWSWLGREAAREGLVVLRASVGRAGETAVVQRDDAELVTVVRDDLADLLGITAVPIDALVSRWGGGLPQYAPGHVERVATLRTALRTLPGLEACGAAYDGVGVPACIASAQDAALRLTTGRMGHSSHG